VRQGLQVSPHLIGCDRAREADLVDPALAVRAPLIAVAHPEQDANQANARRRGSGEKGCATLVYDHMAERISRRHYRVSWDWDADNNVIGLSVQAGAQFCYK
jgi:hypothetical protein